MEQNEMDNSLKSDDHPLKAAFLGWQCRVRQIIMRQGEGRPEASIMPDVTLPGEVEPMGSVITIMSKRPAFSRVPEFRHMVQSTNDPAQRRQKAIQLLSEAYYQRPHEFSEHLTATFRSDSTGATSIIEAGGCNLSFSAFNQRYELNCRVQRLEPDDALYQATWWHNLLFNPNLDPATIVLSFSPNWDVSSADPSPVR